MGSLQQLVVPYVRSADAAAAHRATGALPRDASGRPQNVLVNLHRPEDLAAKLNLNLPDKGHGKDGLLDVIRNVLEHSVNTWDQGFLDKLYASNTPVGPRLRSPSRPHAHCNLRSASFPTWCCPS